MENFIPHEAIIYDDTDPPWTNNILKRNFTNEIVSTRFIA